MVVRRTSTPAQSKFKNKRGLLTESGIILKPEDMRRLHEMGMTPTGTIFDSVLEAEYYRDVLLPQVKAGKFEVSLQHEFIVQERFVKKGKSHKPIIYVPDFLVKYPDGKLEAIDVKGMQTDVFIMKRKMFDFHYPDIDLLVIKRVIKYGGWIEVDDYDKRKKQERKEIRALERKASPSRRRGKRAIDSGGSS